MSDPNIAVFSIVVLVIGTLSLGARAVAQEAPREAVSRDIDQLLKSVQGPDSERSIPDGHAPEAPHFLTRKDGYLRVLVAPPAKYFPVSLMVRSDPLATATAFLDEHQAAFGLEDEQLGFVLRATKAGTKRRHVRLEQTYAGIPVLGAQVLVQLNEDGHAEYVSSDIMTEDDALDLKGDWMNPTVLQVDAEFVALGMLMGENPGMQFQAEVPTLMIYEPSIVGNTGPARLVWQMKIVSEPTPWIAERVLVDAQSGEIALRCPLVRNFLDREVYDAKNSLLSILKRTDGSPPCPSVPDVDNAYDGLEYVYEFYRDIHGRDGADDEGTLLKAFVRLCYPNESCPWRNIGWIGEGYNCMFLGEGFVADDIIAHEFAHGVTEYESGLLYMNESGAIDESLADIGGEWVDLTNGSGNDTDQVKWLIGEDLPGGAIRDMNHPAARPYCHADRRNSENWKTLPGDVLPSAGNDYGYVHNNCGIGNKLCCLLTDGGTFNGFHIDPAGIKKVEALYYEVVTNHLLSCAADYNDLYFALLRAADNLEWTAAERLNLDHACRAVEIAIDQKNSSDDAPGATAAKVGTASALYTADVTPTARSAVQPTNTGKSHAADSPAPTSVRESSPAPAQKVMAEKSVPNPQRWQAEVTAPLPVSRPIPKATPQNKAWQPARDDPVSEPAPSRQIKTSFAAPQPKAKEKADSANRLDTESSGKTVETLRHHAWAFPQTMSRSESENLYVLVLIRLPDIALEQIDEMERVALYPEGIKAVAQTTNHFESQDGSGTSIWTAFDRKILLATVLQNGPATLRITGTLTTGQRFDAVGEVHVMEQNHASGAPSK